VDRSTIPDCLGAPAPTAPSIRLPAGACDTHLHVLGPYSKYPLAAQRAYTVPEAPLSALRSYIETTGLSRVVIAHVSAAGKDMRVTMDAMEELGDVARATIMLHREISDSEMASLNERGVRGARLSNAFGYDVTYGSLRDAAERIAPYGWHIAIWPSGPEELQLIARTIGDLPVEIVLDHLAGHCWSPALGIDQDGFALLLKLLQTGKVWLKLSGTYRVSSQAYPWRDLQPFAEKFVQEVPERLVWASDWPHVGMRNGPMPRSGQLLDWLADIGCDEARLRRILVDNPAILFGFDRG
jgi:predicted TIM-barrel fold metal-dependent hydrolase